MKVDNISIEIFKSKNGKIRVVLSKSGEGKNIQDGLLFDDPEKALLHVVDFSAENIPEIFKSFQRA